MNKKRYSILDWHELGCGMSLTMRRGMHSSIKSYHLRKEMRSIRNAITDIRGLSALMLVRLLIRMMRLGMLSSSY
jgi:hypothetical protein